MTSLFKASFVVKCPTRFMSRNAEVMLAAGVGLLFRSIDFFARYSYSAVAINLTPRRFSGYS